jgi:hypothetical protein
MAEQAEKKEGLKIPLLFLAMSLALLAHMAVVYLPQLEWLVRTTPLSVPALGAILLLGLSVVFIVEVDKHLLRRSNLQSVATTMK